MNKKSIYVSVEPRSVRADIISAISSLNNVIINGQSSKSSDLIGSLVNKTSEIFVIYDDSEGVDLISILDLNSVFPFSLKIIVVSSSHNILFIRDLMKRNVSAFIYLRDFSPNV